MSECVVTAVSLLSFFMFLGHVCLKHMFYYRELSLISAGTSEYTLTQEDVGTHVTFVYIPANFEGWFSSRFFSLGFLLRRKPQIIEG